MQRGRVDEDDVSGIQSWVGGCEVLEGALGRGNFSSIQTVEDALKCVEVGVQGIVVSNHGGGSKMEE